jgi:hypothetical protein
MKQAVSGAYFSAPSIFSPTAVIIAILLRSILVKNLLLPFVGYNLKVSHSRHVSNNISYIICRRVPSCRRRLGLKPTTAQWSISSPNLSCLISIVH